MVFTPAEISISLLAGSYKLTPSVP